MKSAAGAGCTCATSYSIKSKKGRACAVAWRADTVITMVNGKKFVVTESVGEILSRVVEYKNSVAFGRKTPWPDPANPDYNREANRDP